MAKDKFSAIADQYASFRPGYPEELFDWIGEQCVNRENCWDCATGNGQLAKHLATRFQDIYATDISDRQMKLAPSYPNIRYSRQQAEKTDFPAHFFDAVTVGQAIHWFNFEAFYQEVRRVTRPDGKIFVIGYGLLRISPELNPVIDHLHDEIFGPYWDDARKYIDEKYGTIPFPFEEIKVPEFSMNTMWNLDQLHGYLSSWSSVREYIKLKGDDPLPYIRREIANKWGNDEQKLVHFPFLLRAGKLR